MREGGGGGSPERLGSTGWVEGVEGRARPDRFVEGRLKGIC